METNLKTKKRRNLMIILITLVTTVFFLLGGATYMGIKLVEYRQEQQKIKEQDHALYKRGFRLLEEQIATYIKEHYEGVSKIEFSPIYEYGGDGSGMFTLDMVPAITDKFGHRAVLGGKIGRVHHKSYGLGGELTLDFDGADDSEIILLKKLDTGEEVDVSNAKTLPEEAKVETYSALDDNVEALVQDGQLEGVTKSEKGSPDLEVVYNLEIRKGDYSKWR